MCKALDRLLSEAAQARESTRNLTIESEFLSKGILGVSVGN